MILTDPPFKKLTQLLLDDTENKIDFILIDYKYAIKNKKIKLLKQFVPIYNDVRIKRKSGVQIEITPQDLRDVLSVSMALVVYDKQRYEELQNSDIENLVSKIIRNSGNEERYERVMEALEKNNIDISNYTLLINNENFLNTLSYALHAQSIYNNVMTDISKLDKHFLKKEQIVKLVKSMDGYDDEIYESLSLKKQKEYIENLYKNVDKISLYFNNDITRNITTILKKYNNYTLLKKYFFDEDDYLIVIDNIYCNKIIPKPSTIEMMKRIYNTIYDFISIYKRLSLHPTAKTIHKQIINEIKFVNLYNYVDDYGAELYSKSLDKLYKRMEKNRLSEITVCEDLSSYYKEKLDESSFYKYKMSQIAHEQSSKIAIEMESNYDGVSNIDEYKKYFIKSKIDSEPFYKQYFEENDIANPKDIDIMKAEARKYQQIYKNDFLFEHYKLEKEFEDIVVEEYVKVSKKDTVEDIEDEYITELRDSIPSTKLVKGKRKKLTKKEKEIALQEKITTYKEKQNAQKSQQAFDDNFEAKTDSESEIETLLSDFFGSQLEKNAKNSSEDFFYNIMKLGLEK